MRTSQDDHHVTHTTKHLPIAQISNLPDAPSTDEPCTWQLELHPSGGLLWIESGFDLTTGDGVTITMRLAMGAPMQFCARVRWVRLRAGSARHEAWVEFVGLSPSERREFERWLRYYRHDRGSARVSVTLSRKYRVQREGPQLRVWLGGQFGAAEADALAQEILDKAEPSRAEVLALYLDARYFTPSSQASLEHLRDCLSELARRARVLGVLVTPANVGGLQLERVRNEAGLSEVLPRFTSRATALSTWVMILEEIAALEAAVSSGFDLLRLS